MALLAGIIFGLVFAFISIKKGLYVTWVRMVNIILAIYLSVFLTPSVSSCCEYVADAQYGYTICMIIIAAVVFLILHAFTTTFLTGIFKISLPKIPNFAGSVILGFISGLLIWSFGCFVLLLTPLPHCSIAQNFDIPAQLVRSSVPQLRLTCGFVNLCSFQGEKSSASKVLDSLLYVEEEPEEDEYWIEEELPVEEANEPTEEFDEEADYE